MAGTYSALVARAAKWFDAMHPEWAKEIPDDGRFRIDEVDSVDEKGRTCGCLTVHLELDNVDRAQMPDFVKEATLWDADAYYDFPKERIQELWEEELKARDPRRATA